MQNRTDSGTPRFNTPQRTWMDISIKVAKCAKYEIKAYNVFRFLVCSQYFKFSFNYELTSKTEVINCRN